MVLLYFVDLAELDLWFSGFLPGMVMGCGLWVTAEDKRNLHEVWKAEWNSSRCALGVVHVIMICRLPCWRGAAAEPADLAPAESCLLVS